MEMEMVTIVDHAHNYTDWHCKSCGANVQYQNYGTDTIKIVWREGSSEFINDTFIGGGTETRPKKQDGHIRYKSCRLYSSINPLFFLQTIEFFTDHTNIRVVSTSS